MSAKVAPASKCMCARVDICIERGQGFMFLCAVEHKIAHNNSQNPVEAVSTDY